MCQFSIKRLWEPILLYLHTDIKHWKQQATIPCFLALENQIMLCVLGTQVPLLTYIRGGLTRDLELKMAKICNHANAYQIFLEDFHFDLFSELSSFRGGQNIEGFLFAKNTANFKVLTHLNQVLNTFILNGE